MRESPTTRDPELETALGRIAHLEATLASARATITQRTAERDKLRHAYEQLKEQLELLRRRLFVAKAERVDTTQLQMEFSATQAKLGALATQLEGGVAASGVLDASAAAASPSDPSANAKPRTKPTGRRDLGFEEMPEERVEIVNPALEGTVERIGFEESFTLAYRRGGRVRLVLARATYKSQPVPKDDRGEEEPAFKIVTAPMPKMMFPRGLLAPSMIAHMLVQKYR